MDDIPLEETKQPEPDTQTLSYRLRQELNQASQEMENTQIREEELQRDIEKELRKTRINIKKLKQGNQEEELVQMRINRSKLIKLLMNKDFKNLKL